MQKAVSTVSTLLRFFLMSCANFWIVCSQCFCICAKGRVKKNWEKAVRLTAWVDHPLPSPKAVRKM